MKINIKASIVDLTPSIKIFIEDKLGGLGKYVKKYDEEGAVGLWVEIERTTRHHRKGEIFHAVANLRLPGKVLRAEEHATDIRTAIDTIKNTLHIEIEKYRESHSAIGSRKMIRSRRGK